MRGDSRDPQRVERPDDYERGETARQREQRIARELITHERKVATVTGNAWENEPDRLEWRDEPTGLPCLIKRGPSGALCGYVAVTPSHPWHGVGYSGCTLPHGQRCESSYCSHYPDVSVHGGLTYSDKCDGAPGEGICHVAQPGEPDDVWWFGFDCAHCGDLSPRYGQVVGDEVYRDIEYVRAEVTGLARQLAAIV